MSYERPADMAADPAGERYTLAEARKIITRQECDRDGHRLDQQIIHGYGGPSAHLIRCERCGARFEESQ